MFLKGNKKIKTIMCKGRSILSENPIAPLDPQNPWTTSRKPKIYNCYGVLESVAWIWRVLGVYPIAIKSLAGSEQYGISKFYAAYSFLLFIICFGNFGFGLTKFNVFISTHIIMTSATIWIRTMASLLCMVITNVWRIYRSKELSESINKISEQEIILEKMSCRFNYESSARIVRVYVWITFSAILGFMAFDVYASIKSWKNLTLEWLFWIIPLIAQVVDLTILVCLVGLLGLKFRAVNERIKTVVTRANSSSPKVIMKSDVCAEKLRALSKVHYNICAIGKRINGLFGWDVVINVATAFIILSTTLYYIFYEVEREGKTDFVRILTYIHWEFIHSAPIIVIVVVCNWTSRQAVYTGRLIHEIRVENTDCRLYEALKSFSLQLHHQKLEFTAGGFFPLNSTLLQSMVANITTYLVILIQFQPKLDDN